MDTNAWWYIGGQWVHPDKATISINDVAVLRGYSVFESLRTYNRRPFHLRFTPGASLSLCKAD